MAEVSLPFINGNDPNLKFLLMIPSGRHQFRSVDMWSHCASDAKHKGILAMCSGAFVKAPVIDISKQA